MDARAVSLVFLLLGCTAGSTGPPPLPPPPDGGPLPDRAMPDRDPDAGGHSSTCAPGTTGGDPVVYAHAVLIAEGSSGPHQTHLAILDTQARRIREWIPIECEEEGGGYIDLAVDEEGRIMMAGANVFAWFDPETRGCTAVSVPVPHIEEDDIWVESVGTPNNLTFVPAGVLDPTRQMMAGFGLRYIDHRRPLYESGFVRFDPDDGSADLVYEWPDVGLGISGDLVVVLDTCTWEPRTFATLIGSRDVTRCHACADGEVPGVDCGDCLYEFDVRTGRIAEEIELLPADKVFGLALWGDSLYGFSAGSVFDQESGKIFSISPGADSTAVEEIPVDLPEGYVSAHFMGAGSTVLAPILF